MEQSKIIDTLETYQPPEQIQVEPSIAMVKDLLADNIDGHVIYFCDARPGGLCTPRWPPALPLCSINTPIFQKP